MCGAPHARPTATTWATDDELVVTRMHAGGCVCVAIRQEQRYRRRDGVRRPVRRPGTESATRQLVDFPPPCAASSLAASAGSSRRPVSSCRRRRPWNGPPIGSRAGISGCFRCRRSLPGVPRPARRRHWRSHWTRRRRRRLGRLVKPTTSRTAQIGGLAFRVSMFRTGRARRLRQSTGRRPVGAVSLHAQTSKCGLRSRAFYGSHAEEEPEGGPMTNDLATSGVWRLACPVGTPTAPSSQGLAAWRWTALDSGQ